MKNMIVEIPVENDKDGINMLMKISALINETPRFHILDYKLTQADMRLITINHMSEDEFNSNSFKTKSHLKIVRCNAG